MAKFQSFAKEQNVLKFFFVIDQKSKRIAGKDIDYILNNLTKTCFEEFDRFSPLRKISKPYQKSWITPNNIKMCKKKDSLHAKMV